MVSSLSSDHIFESIEKGMMCAASRRTTELLSVMLGALIIREIGQRYSSLSTPVGL